MRDWKYRYRYTPFSNDVKQQLEAALKRGLDGKAKCPIPSFLVNKVESRVKPRPAPDEIPLQFRGVRLSGSTEEDIQRIVEKAKELNYSIPQEQLETFPEYLLVDVGKGRHIELYHEQTGGLQVRKSTRVVQEKT